MTGDVKAMILAALDAAGGAEYLLRQADENPAAFMTLVGKVLPTQLTGKDDGPIRFENVSDDSRVTIDAMMAEFTAAREALDGTKH